MGDVQVEKRSLCGGESSPPPPPPSQKLGIKIVATVPRVQPNKAVPTLIR